MQYLHVLWRLKKRLNLSFSCSQRNYHNIQDKCVVLLHLLLSSPLNKKAVASDEKAKTKTIFRPHENFNILRTRMNVQSKAHRIKVKDGEGSTMTLISFFFRLGKYGATQWEIWRHWLADLRRLKRSKHSFQDNCDTKTSRSTLQRFRQLQSLDMTKA